MPVGLRRILKRHSSSSGPGNGLQLLDEKWDSFNMADIDQQLSQVDPDLAPFFLAMDAEELAEHEQTAMEQPR